MSLTLERRLSALETAGGASGLEIVYCKHGEPLAPDQQAKKDNAERDGKTTVVTVSFVSAQIQFAREGACMLVSGPADEQR